MRFRRSIRIMKGVRVNFSSSGISLTAGVRGASINIGPKGTYLNTGIPGTGLYNRTKISDSSSSRSSYSSHDHSHIDLSFTVEIDDDGNYCIMDRYDEIITDESLLRKIKRTEAYKNKILYSSEEFANEKNAETEAFVEIYQKSKKIISVSEIQDRLSNLSPQKYVKSEYSGREPDKIAIKNHVENEARKKVKSVAFWTLKKKRLEYFNTEFPLRLQAEIDKYDKSVQEHNEKEAQIEIEKNAEYLNIYNAEKKHLEDHMAGSKIFVESNLESFLQSMTLPVNFEVSYDYDQGSGILKADLNLPEIEDMPKSKAATLSSGKVKVKEKTQKELNEQYLVCVTGLAFFFASHFFNLSTNIRQILISGFTQRINKKTGQIDDEYVYSVLFDREVFKNIDARKIVPYLAFEGFEHRINYSKTYELTIIEPISEVRAKG